MEQHAWHDAVSLSDVSHHMFDTFIAGPDATRLLSDVSANNYENFAVGGYYSDNIEDYYVSPWELGYGRSISFNHDFIGRDALRAAKETAPRTKVTLVLRPEDVDVVLGEDHGYYLTYARHRVELAGGDGNLIGLTHQTATLDTAGTILALTLINKEHATPGTQVTVTWGEHPGAGTAGDADLGFQKIRATVAPAPYDAYAATQYRHH